jgi:hypothetical protein
MTLVHVCALGLAVVAQAAEPEPSGIVWQSTDGHFAATIPPGFDEATVTSEELARENAVSGSRWVSDHGVILILQARVPATAVIDPKVVTQGFVEAAKGKLLYSNSETLNGVTVLSAGVTAPAMNHAVIKQKIAITSPYVYKLMTLGTEADYEGDSALEKCLASFEVRATAIPRPLTPVRDERFSERDLNKLGGQVGALAIILLGAIIGFGLQKKRKAKEAEEERAQSPPAKGDSEIELSPEDHVDETEPSEEDG